MNKAQAFRFAFRQGAVFRSADWKGRCFWTVPALLGVYVMGSVLAPNSHHVPPLKRRVINAGRKFHQRMIKKNRKMGFV